MSRAGEIDGFLARTAYAGAQPAWLAGDASTRRYARVGVAGQPGAMLMDAPPGELVPNRAFLHMTQALRGVGYSAPEILAAEVDRGLMLLEDLGDALFARVLERAPDREAPLYGAAVDLLADLGGRVELAEGLPPYDMAFYLTEISILLDWYMPAFAKSAAAPGLLDAMGAALSALPDAPVVCVLRDYHAENLIWLPERDGFARVGLLDYQGAMAGHPAYDLVSLLEDARRDVCAEVQPQMRARFAEGTGRSLTDIDHAVAVLGAQRNLKILGIFARLALREGKARYLGLIPRVWGHVQRDLTHPALADVASIVRAHVPAPTPARVAAVEAAVEAGP